MPASIPVWVPVLFLGLVLLGYRQARPRTVKPGTLVAVALAMFGFSLYGVVGALGPEPQALLSWAAGYAAVVTLGARDPASRGLVAVGTSVRVPGSWVPLALLMGIFAAKFALGFAAGVHSPLVHHAGFMAIVSGVLGALSGGFGARAVAVHRCATSAASPARSAAPIRDRHSSARAIGAYRGAPYDEHDGHSLEAHAALQGEASRRTAACNS